MPTNEDVRAAAERVIAEASVPDGDKFDRMVKLRRMNEAAAYLSAALAEHPEDNGEPVTEEWLRGIGFENRPFPDHGNPLCVRIGMSWVLAVWTNGEVRISIAGTYEALPSAKTRGQVRRLIAALKGEQ